MPWDRASRLKSASQRSKLPVFLQFGWAKAGALASSRAAVASVPIPKFANTRGTFACELLNPRDTSNFMILVPLLNPKFAIGLAALACELRVRGTSSLTPVAGTIRSKLEATKRLPAARNAGRNSAVHTGGNHVTDDPAGHDDCRAPGSHRWHASNGASASGYCGENRGDRTRQRPGQDRAALCSAARERALFRRQNLPRREIRAARAQYARPVRADRKSVV